MEREREREREGEGEIVTIKNTLPYMFVQMYHVPRRDWPTSIYH